ncbi:mis18-binding protein 1 isoform X2 [Erpetoichthys calabaricus]|uniref:mis18-binding protein 1 isoform X2 n=1 Tax=Erpetoichthys calabaricus TaxID=27687 RepID=UPI0022344D8B|nr:mis18-binding protein 1 isoform X2 [Erpetoichthys calabaricus]
MLSKSEYKMFMSPTKNPIHRREALLPMGVPFDDIITCATPVKELLKKAGVDRSDSEKNDGPVLEDKAVQKNVLERPLKEVMQSTLIHENFNIGSVPRVYFPDISSVVNSSQSSLDISNNFKGCALETRMKKPCAPRNDNADSKHLEQFFNKIKFSTECYGANTKKETKKQFDLLLESSKKRKRQNAPYTEKNPVLHKSPAKRGQYPGGKSEFADIRSSQANEEQKTFLFSSSNFSSKNADLLCEVTSVQAGVTEDCVFPVQRESKVILYGVNGEKELPTKGSPCTEALATKNIQALPGSIHIEKTKMDEVPAVSTGRRVISDIFTDQQNSHSSDMIVDERQEVSSMQFREQELPNFLRSERNKQSPCKVVFPAEHREHDISEDDQDISILLVSFDGDESTDNEASNHTAKTDSNPMDISLEFHNSERRSQRRPLSFTNNSPAKATYNGVLETPDVQDFATSPKIYIPRSKNHKKQSEKKVPEIKVNDVTDAKTEPTGIHLYEWEIKPINQTGICVEGIRRDMNEEALLWHSNLICKRIARNVVMTITGSVYVLVGKMNPSSRKSKEFPSSFLKKFAFGFPQNWKVHCKNYIKELNRSKSKASKGSKAITKVECKHNSETESLFQKSVQSPNATFSLETMKITRSGRRIKPPLEYWRGQRMIIDRDFNVRLDNGHVNYLNKEETQDVMPNHRSKLSTSKVHTKRQPYSGNGNTTPNLKGYRGNLLNFRKQNGLKNKSNEKNLEVSLTSLRSVKQLKEHCSKYHVKFNQNQLPKSGLTYSLSESQSEVLHPDDKCDCSSEDGRISFQRKVKVAHKTRGSSQTRLFGLSSNNYSNITAGTVVSQFVEDEACSKMKNILQEINTHVSDSDSDKSVPLFSNVRSRQPEKNQFPECLLTTQEEHDCCVTSKVRSSFCKSIGKPMHSEKQPISKRVNQQKSTSKIEQPAKKYSLRSSFVSSTVNTVDDVFDISTNQKNTTANYKLFQTKKRNPDIVVGQQHSEDLGNYDSKQDSTEDSLNSFKSPTGSVNHFKNGTDCFLETEGTPTSVPCKKTIGTSRKKLVPSQSVHVKQVCSKEMVNEMPWVKEELQRLHLAVASIPKRKKDYWVDVSMAVGTRSATECQKKYMEVHQTSRNINSKKKKLMEQRAPAKVPLKIDAKVGTLKRKRQMRQFLEQISKDEHDDIFSASPLGNRKVKTFKVLATPSRRVSKRLNDGKTESVVGQLFKKDGEELSNHSSDEDHYFSLDE